MHETLTFRPKSNYVWGGVALLLDALFVVQSVFYSADGESIWFDLAIAALVAGVVVLLWLRPKLVLHQDHLVVVNPLSTRVIRFENIKELDTKWALQIVHTQGQTRVWVASATGKFHWMADANQSRILNRAARNQGRVVDVTSASQSLHSDSGLAAHLIRQRLEQWH